MGPRTRTAVWCMLAGVLCVPDPVQSSETPVTITVRSCDGVSQQEVTRILMIELRTIARGREEVESAPTTVAAECREGEIVLSAQVTSKADVHTDLLTQARAAHGQGTERLIAIAAAELIFSAWIALLPSEESPGGAAGAGKALPRKQLSEEKAETQPPRTAPPAEKPESAPPAEKPEMRRNPSGYPRLALSIGPTWRLFVSGKNQLFGGEFATTLTLTRHLRAGLGGSVEGGRCDRQLGRVRQLAASARVSIELARRFSRVIGGIGAGARLGGGVLKGTTAESGVQSESVDGGFGGPVLLLSVQTDRSIYAAFACELGYAAFGNIGRVTGDTPVYMKGLFAAAKLSVGFDLSTLSR